MEKIPADIMKQEDELEGRATHRDPARRKLRPEARPMMRQGKGTAVKAIKSISEKRPQPDWQFLNLF